jgi:general secretion pathway protein D
VRRRRLKALALAAVLMVATGCAAGKAFRQGNAATQTGDLDQAVAYYRTAAQADPDNPNYKIALDRAMLAASRAHFEKAKEFEEAGQLEAARGEYQIAAEYDPTNRQAVSKVAALDQTIRTRIEASRPRPAIEGLRDRARASSAPPLINPASREPLNMRFTNSNIRDILNAIGTAAGIDIQFDPQVPQTAVTVNLNGVTVEQALQQILSVNQLAYKVQTERSVLVFPDTPPKHAQYDEQVIQTFYVSHADVTELTQLLSSLVRLPSLAVQPAIQFNKTANTITVRGTTALVQIIEKIIAQNDKPRAEIVIDVEILEVNRTRAKNYGLNLSEYALGAIFSPEVSPGATTTPAGGTGGTGGATGGTATTGGQSTTPSGVTSPPPFNLNTISRGLSAADFYFAVPTFIVRFLESDTNTKLVAKPQLRGAEGSKLTLKLGDSIPVIQTSFTPIAAGGAATNPLASYSYRDVGVNIEMTPKVTADGDIILDLTVDNSSLGGNVSVAGQSVPSFGQRTVTTRLRLRDGESNLLAGLLREDERKSLNGFPGAVRVPILKQLFSNNENSISQTDIVMLLTPHIIRTSEITEADLRPIYIGSQGNLGIGGPAPLIAAPADGSVTPAGGTTPAAPAPAPAPGTPPGAPSPTGGGTIIAPPGTSPVPGTVFVPDQPAPAPAPAPPAPPPPGGGAAPDSPGAAAPATPPTSPDGTAPGAVPPEPTAITPPASGAAPDTPAAGTASPGFGSALMFLTPPATPFRVGGGPYTVPITIANATRLSNLTITVTFNPDMLRVRAVNEGSFMRSGGASAVFTQQASAGRIDITITRAADASGATGTGLIGAIMFDAVGPGTASLAVSGTATGPGGTPMGLQFRPTTVTIQP